MHARVLQQLQAPRKRQHRAAGKLVRRRHADHARCIDGQAIRAQAVFIDIRTVQARAVDLQHLAQREVLRFFDDRHVARVEQDARGERHRLLRAADDEHVFRHRLHAAAAREVIADRFAQRGHALRIGIVGRGVGGGVREFARPRGRQRGIHQRQAVLERVTHRCARLVAQQPGNVGVARAAGVGGLRRCDRRGRVVRRFGHQGRGDETPRSDARGHEAFRAQLFVGGQHRVARQAEIAGERARRRQAAALPQAAAGQRRFSARVSCACRGPRPSSCRCMADLRREWPHSGPVDWPLPVPIHGRVMRPILPARGPPCTFAPPGPTPRPSREAHRAWPAWASVALGGSALALADLAFASLYWFLYSGADAGADRARHRLVGRRFARGACRWRRCGDRRRVAVLRDGRGDGRRLHAPDDALAAPASARVDRGQRVRHRDVWTVVRSLRARISPRRP